MFLGDRLYLVIHMYAGTNITPGVTSMESAAPLLALSKYPFTRGPQPPHGEIN